MRYVQLHTYVNSINKSETADAPLLFIQWTLSQHWVFNPQRLSIWCVSILPQRRHVEQHTQYRPQEQIAIKNKYETILQRSRYLITLTRHFRPVRIVHNLSVFLFVRHSTTTHTAYQPQEQNAIHETLLHSSRYLKQSSLRNMAFQAGKNRVTWATSVFYFYALLFVNTDSTGDRINNKNEAILQSDAVTIPNLTLTTRFGP